MVFFLNGLHFFLVTFLFLTTRKTFSYFSNVLFTTVFQAQSPDFREYQKQVLANAKVMGEELVKRGYKVISGRHGYTRLVTQFVTMVTIVLGVTESGDGHFQGE